MEEQKILFADLYRLTEDAKEKIKILNKVLPGLLKVETWPNITKIVNGISLEATNIRRIAGEIEHSIKEFVTYGLYEGQRAGSTPLESMADKETK